MLIFAATSGRKIEAENDWVAPGFHDQPVARQAVSDQIITRTYTFKLYPNHEQVSTLKRWLGKCCWLYNQALEQRIKTYKRRGESVTFYDQCAWLTGLRDRIESVRLIPVQFARDALRRVDRGMKAFFRRVKAGQKPGFSRFKSSKRYNSLEYLTVGDYLGTQLITVPKLGPIRARGPFESATGKQKALRVLRRASGWYAQIVVELLGPAPLPKTGLACGLDLGLEAFVTLDSGEQIPNPRLLRKHERKLKARQRQLARCQQGSQRRVRAKRKVSLLHEQVARQRRGHAHRTARELVNKYDRIAVEALNVKGLAQMRLAKSVHDAGWGQFLSILIAKAESAGRIVVTVNPAGTSMTCPVCGAVKKKVLSERTHRCGCGCILPRDQAAAMIVRRRAFRPGCVEGAATTLATEQAGPVKREGSTHS